MKEFEKWSKTPNGYTERESDYAEGEAAWRAALEWALQIKITSDSSVYLDMLRNRMRDELGNT